MTILSYFYYIGMIKMSHWTYTFLIRISIHFTQTHKFSIETETFYIMTHQMFLWSHKMPQFHTFSLTAA